MLRNLRQMVLPKIMNHGVKWSDGYDLEGKKKGNTDSGTPGVDASYTGYHYTKSVCQTCGTINSVDGSGAYNFNNNVYGLNSCDHNFLSTLIIRLTSCMTNISTRQH